VTDATEFSRIYKLTFDFRDKYGVDNIFEMDDQITAYAGDIPVQLYETYCFNDAEIKEPDLYKLSISRDRHFVQK
jgi:hypothetical protein